MKKNNCPCGEIFVLLFLVIYCWWTAIYMIYEKGIGYYFKTFGHFGLAAFTWTMLPAFFGYGIYKFHKPYFTEKFNKLKRMFKFISK